MILDGSENPTHAFCRSCCWIGPIFAQKDDCCGNEVCPQCASTDTIWYTRDEAIAEIDSMVDDHDERIKAYEEAELL